MTAIVDGVIVQGSTEEVNRIIEQREQKKQKALDNSRWIKHKWCNWQCHECEKYFPVLEFKDRPFNINFCPNCGADMRSQP